MPAQLTSDGLQIQTLEEILAELRADVTAPGALPDHDVTSPTSPVAVLVALQARREAIYQALLASVLDALYRDGASGRQLDRVATITGDPPRLPPSQSTILGRLTGTPGTDCSNKLVRYRPNNTLWRTPGIGATIEGGGTVDVELRAEDDGPIEAAEASEDWEIVTLTTGWDEVESLSGLQVGELEEDDPTMRERLVASESVARATEEAISSTLLRVPGVSSVAVDNNRELVPNASGVPGKSVECLVVGGSDAEVAEAIFGVVCADTGLFGNTSADVERPDGRLQTIRFSRIDEVRVYAAVTIQATGAEEDLPTDYEEQIRLAVAQRSAQLAPGQDMHSAWFVGAIVDALPTNSVVDVDVEFADDPLGVFAPTFALTTRQLGEVPQGKVGARYTGLVAQPFDISAGWHLDLAIDGGGTQVVTFPAISQATAQDVVDEISAVLVNGTASATLGRVRIESNDAGPSSEVEVLGTSTPALQAALGLPTGSRFGADSGVVSIIVT